MSAEKIDELKAKNKQYFHKNRVEKCKKVIGIYCERSIARINLSHADEVNKLYVKYPYEKYGERLINIALRQYGIKSNSHKYDDCVDAGMMAYLYSIARCAIINCTNFQSYTNKVIRIYIKCALIVSNENMNICNENNFKLVLLDNLENRSRY